MDHYTNRKNLVRVAKLYYVAGLSQEEISVTMGISRSKVSRMLTLAKNLKIVRFQISEYPSLHQELEQELSQRLGLKRVIVVSPSAEESPKAAVGRAAARFLREHVHDGMLIGIEWGSTADCMVDAYEGKVSASGVELMQITGGMHISDSILDGRELVKRLAHKMCVPYRLLQYPMVVNSALLAGMIMQDDNKEYFQRMRDMDMVIVGLGSDIPEKSATYLGGYITLQQSEELVRQGYAADICGHRLTSEGRPAQTMLSGRMVTIPLEYLKHIPIRMGISAGADKRQSILAAAKGGYINTLVVDDIAAIAVAGQG